MAQSPDVVEAILASLREDLREVQQQYRELERAFREQERTMERMHQEQSMIRRDREVDHDILIALSRLLKGDKADGSDSITMRLALAERVMMESANALKEAAGKRWDLVKGVVVGMALIVAGALLKWIVEGH